MCAAAKRRQGAQTLEVEGRPDYVPNAIDVARNADLRETLRRQILEAGADLFEDRAVVREQ